LKKFHFRLERYRHLKAQEEKAAQMEFVKAQKEFQDETARLTALRQKNSELLALNRKLLQGKLQRELLDACYGCLLVQRNSLAEQTDIVFQAEEKMKGEQRVYIEARKSSKLLDRLYQRQWTAYYQEFLHSEQKMLDEIGLISYLKD
jgi:flagellar export protein FliJ